MLETKLETQISREIDTTGKESIILSVPSIQKEVENFNKKAFIII